MVVVRLSGRPLVDMYTSTNSAPIDTLHPDNTLPSPSVTAPAAQSGTAHSPPSQVWKRRLRTALRFVALTMRCAKTMPPHPSSWSRVYSMKLKRNWPPYEVATDDELSWSSTLA